MRKIACVALFAVGCSSPAGDPEPITRTFGPFDLASGDEVADLCASWTLDNEETVYVNAVDLYAGTGFHHSNWFFVPDNIYEGADGVWPCDERGFSAPIASAKGGVLFAQSTQATHESQAFQPGVAIAIPAGARIAGELHMLNASDGPIHTDLTLEISPIAERDVEVRLSPLSLQYERLALPPKARSRFSSRCDFAAEHQRQLERPLDFSLYYVLPHYHALGLGMRVEALGGPDGDAVVFENQTAIGEPLGKLLDEPFDFTGYEALRFSCEFDNPRDETVTWGIGDQEMCVFLGFTDSELQWGGGVVDLLGGGGEAAEGEMGEDGVVAFDDECQLIAVWAN